MIPLSMLMIKKSNENKITNIEYNPHNDDIELLREVFGGEKWISFMDY